jgi:DNA polymerase-1
MAHSLYPEFEKKLAFHQSLWTRHPFHKDDGKQFNIKRDNIIKYLQYNARDAVVTRELYDVFEKQAREIQIPGFPNWADEWLFGYALKLHDFYRRMESVGLKTNKDRQNELIAEYVEKLRMVKMEMDSITGGGINYNSHPQIRKLLYKKPGLEDSFEHSFGLPERKGTDEDTLVALAANNTKNPVHKRAIELLLDYRRIRKTLGTYLVAEADYDGRMRTSYRICGTETGRSSTGILKPPVRPEKIGLAFQTLTKHGDIGPEIRSEFDADPGYSFVETDMSQAEARIVALLGNMDKTLDLFRRKADIHRLTASWIFGLTPEQITNELRFIGKTTRHAGNYGMGKNRLMHIVNTDAKKFNIKISISEWKAGIILKKFHDFEPNIVGVFHAAIEKALADNNRVLVNPFGRYRQFFGEWGHDLFKEAYAHIPQSTVPDHLRRAGMRAERRFAAENIDARFVIEAHDAFIALVRDEHIDRYIRIIHEEIEQPIDFSRCTISRGTLVIPAESKVGKNYRECKVKGCGGCKYLHDYKVKVMAA